MTSVNEIIETVESLDVHDTITVTDSVGATYTGVIIGFEKFEEYREILLETDDSSPSCSLKIWYDIEGGPTHVSVQPVEKDSSTVTDIVVQ